MKVETRSEKPIPLAFRSVKGRFNPHLLWGQKTCSLNMDILFKIVLS
jgi:hypothetical protein